MGKQHGRGIARAGTVAAVVLAALAARAAPAPAPARQTCWIGEVRRTLPDGGRLAAAGALMRRTERPGAGTIVEQVIELEFDEAPREVITMFEVDGARLTVACRERGLSGSGELAGEPGQCSGWSYRAEYAAGTGSVRVAFEVTAEGLRAQRVYFSPEGEARVRTEEIYRPIGCELFDLLHRWTLVR